MTGDIFCISTTCEMGEKTHYGQIYSVWWSSDAMFSYLFEVI